jgi:hypothetical protein
MPVPDETQRSHITHTSQRDGKPKIRDMYIEGTEDEELGEDM